MQEAEGTFYFESLAHNATIRTIATTV